MTATTPKPSLDKRGSAVVQTLNDAITAAMNELGDRHGCRPLNWYLREIHGFDRGDVVGFPKSDEEPADALRLVQQWATVLDLVEEPDGTTGYRTWLGTVAHRNRIEIWCKA